MSRMAAHTSNRNQTGLASTGWQLALMLCCLCLASGCKHFSLPAIDPNGSKLFLPHPNATQLTLPTLHPRNGQPGLLPSAAFQPPATPPPCLDGRCEPTGVCNLFHRKHQHLHKIHDHFRTPGKAGEIQLTPLRVIAPVGGEVVFLAGICGEDGYLVKQQPLEWMLSPDSVGQIIQVSDDSPGKLSGLLHPNRPKVEKLGIDFARARTSSKPLVIDRGTPGCEDDIHLRDGEAWVSVSSPTAGVSRLTALAPDSNLWDRRRQTAVVYWLDAQYTLPEPQMAVAGGNVQLSTRVTKSEGFVPATGWIVQYTIVDPNVAAFVSPTLPSSNPQQARVRVDENGMATAHLTAPPNGRGTTPVIVEVLSPEQPSDHLPELLFGRGETLVTFSSPGLNLQVFGPEAAMAGEQLTYVASLGNPGDLNADNARLVLNLPAGMKLIAATPQPASQTGAGAIWDQGVLPANRQLDVSVVLQPAQVGMYEVVFQAEATGLSERKSVRTEVAEATVEVRFAPAGGVSQAEVGNVVQYEVDVRNTGRQTLTNLKLLVETDPGLVEANTGSNRVDQVIGALSPGQVRSLGIPLQVRQEGQQSAKLRVMTAGDSVLVERVASILGQPPRPRRPEIGVDIQFPWSESGVLTEMRVGQTAYAQITLRNSGETKLSGIKVLVTASSSVLDFIGVDVNNQSTVRSDGEGRWLWKPADMLPGQGSEVIRQLWVQVRARAGSPSAQISVQASSDEGVGAQAVGQTRVVTGDTISPPVLPPSGQPNAPSVLPQTQESTQSPAATGALAISINHFNDPTLVGRQIRYGLRVVNNSNSPNHRVHVEMMRPDGARLVGITTREGQELQANFRDNRVLLPIVEYMRPGEELNYIIVLISDIPQQMQVLARVYSDTFQTPVQASETSTIINPGS
ncbi:MAG: hypothetical protein KF752_20050 [Pirellulaceae bacterium]|nr:hypothetical protein [Pirellulaceae bacterium]